MSEPPTPIAYATPAARTGVPRVAWIPATALAIVALSPFVYVVTGDPSMPALWRDFGLRPTPSAERALTFLLWYGPGYGWFYAAVTLVVLALVLPRLGRWARVTDGRDAAIWLLSALVVLLTVNLALMRMIGSNDPLRAMITGVTAGGPQRPPPPPSIGP